MSVNAVITAVIVVIVGVAGTLSVVAMAANSASAAPVGRYVALGDSYTSGPFVPTEIDRNCLRSSRAYPSLVSASIGATSFADVSCTGATTTAILHATTGERGGPVPAQIGVVDATTALVTIGIGGNDVDFANIISDCAHASLSNPFGSPCKSRYASGGVDQLRARVNATAPKVAAVLAAVRLAAPTATIAVVGYPDILPDTGVGCWPTVPLSRGDVPYLRGVERALNTMLASVAAAGGASYVDTYTSTIGHDVCTPKGTRWIEGLIPATPAAPFHPNVLGEQAMANAVVGALKS